MPLSGLRPPREKVAAQDVTMSTLFDPERLYHGALFPFPYPPHSLSDDRALQPFNVVSVPLHIKKRGANKTLGGMANTDNPKNWR